MWSLCVKSSTKVFLSSKSWGSHAVDCAAGQSRAENSDDAPHIILLPEVAFNKKAFLAKVKATVKRKGFCVIVVSEGARDADSSFLGESGAAKDAFGACPTRRSRRL